MIRIFYDGYSDTIKVETAKRIFPARSLEFTRDGLNISIWWESVRLIGPIPFGDIANEQGETFPFLNQCVAYLEEVFTKSAMEDEIGLPSEQNFVSVFETELNT